MLAKYQALDVMRGTRRPYEQDPDLSEYPELAKESTEQALQDQDYHEMEERVLAHEIVTRGIFEAIDRAWKLDLPNRWLCPNHAEPLFETRESLRAHLLDGHHDITEAQADILVSFAATERAPLAERVRHSSNQTLSIQSTATSDAQHEPLEALVSQVQGNFSSAWKSNLDPPSSTKPSSQTPPTKPVSAKDKHSAAPSTTRSSPYHGLSHARRESSNDAFASHRSAAEGPPTLTPTAPLPKFVASLPRTKEFAPSDTEVGKLPASGSSAVTTQAAISSLERGPPPLGTVARPQFKWQYIKELGGTFWYDDSRDIIVDEDGRAISRPRHIPRASLKLTFPETARPQSQTIMQSVTTQPRSSELATPTAQSPVAAVSSAIPAQTSTVLPVAQSWVPARTTAQMPAPSTTTRAQTICPPQRSQQTSRSPYAQSTSRGDTMGKLPGPISNSKALPANTALLASRSQQEGAFQPSLLLRRNDPRTVAQITVSRTREHAVERVRQLESETETMNLRSPDQIATSQRLTAVTSPPTETAELQTVIASLRSRDYTREQAIEMIRRPTVNSGSAISTSPPRAIAPRRDAVPTSTFPDTSSLNANTARFMSTGYALKQAVSPAPGATAPTSDSYSRAPLRRESLIVSTSGNATVSANDLSARTPVALSNPQLRRQGGMTRTSSIDLDRQSALIASLVARGYTSEQAGEIVIRGGTKQAVEPPRPLQVAQSTAVQLSSSESSRFEAAVLAMMSRGYSREDAILVTRERLRQRPQNWSG